MRLKQKDVMNATIRIRIEARAAKQKELREKAKANREAKSEARRVASAKETRKKGKGKKKKKIKGMPTKRKVSDEREDGDEKTNDVIDLTTSSLFATALKKPFPPNHEPAFAPTPVPAPESALFEDPNPPAPAPAPLPPAPLSPTNDATSVAKATNFSHKEFLAMVPMDAPGRQPEKGGVTERRVHRKRVGKRQAEAEEAPAKQTVRIIKRRQDGVLAVSGEEGQQVAGEGGGNEGEDCEGLGLSTTRETFIDREHHSLCKEGTVQWREWHELRRLSGPMKTCEACLKGSSLVLTTYKQTAVGKAVDSRKKYEVRELIAWNGRGLTRDYKHGIKLAVVADASAVQGKYHPSKLSRKLAHTSRKSQKQDEKERERKAKDSARVSVLQIVFESAAQKAAWSVVVAHNVDLYHPSEPTSQYAYQANGRSKCWSEPVIRAERVAKSVGHAQSAGQAKAVASEVASLKEVKFESMYYQHAQRESLYHKPISTYEGVTATPPTEELYNTDQPLGPSGDDTDYETDGESSDAGFDGGQWSRWLAHKDDTSFRTSCTGSVFSERGSSFGSVFGEHTRAQSRALPVMVKAFW
jgi:hypothetical protein